MILVWVHISLHVWTLWYLFLERLAMATSWIPFGSSTIFCTHVDTAGGECIGRTTSAGSYMTRASLWPQSQFANIILVAGELIVSKYVAESITMIAGHFSHEDLCQLHAKLKKLQCETCYIASTGQWCCGMKSGCINDQWYYVIVLCDEEWVHKWPIILRDCACVCDWLK